jgi:hypothetical protein
VLQFYQWFVTQPKRNAWFVRSVFRCSPQFRFQACKSCIPLILLGAARSPWMYLYSSFQTLKWNLWILLFSEKSFSVGISVSGSEFYFLFPSSESNERVGRFFGKFGKPITHQFASRLRCRDNGLCFVFLVPQVENHGNLYQYVSSSYSPDLEEMRDHCVMLMYLRCLTGCS